MTTSQLIRALDAIEAALLQAIDSDTYGVDEMTLVKIGRVVLHTEDALVLAKAQAEKMYLGSLLNDAYAAWKKSVEEGRALFTQPNRQEETRRVEERVLVLEGMGYEEKSEEKNRTPFASESLREVCRLCRELPSAKYASQKYGADDNTYLPILFEALANERGTPFSVYSDPERGLYHCPYCGLKYAMETTHDYYVDGSEDTQEYTRLPLKEEMRA